MSLNRKAMVLAVGAALAGPVPTHRSQQGGFGMGVLWQVLPEYARVNGGESTANGHGDFRRFS